MKEVKDVQLHKETDKWTNSLNDLSPAARKAAKELDGTSDSLERAQKTGINFGGVLKNIGYSLLNAVLMAAASWLVSVAVTAISNYINRVELAAEATDTAISKVEDAKQELSNLGKEAETVSARIDELRGLQGTSAWNKTLELELSNLEKQNEALLTNIALAKHKEGIGRTETKKAILEEISKTYGSGVKFIDSDEVTSFGPGKTSKMEQDVAFEYAKTRLTELSKLRGLSPAQKEEYEQLYNWIVDFGIAYSDWASTARELDLGISEDTISDWEKIANAASTFMDAFTSVKIPTSTLSSRVSESLDGNGYLAGYLSDIENANSEAFLAEDNQNSPAYLALKALADTEAQSVNTIIDILKGLGFFQGDVPATTTIHNAGASMRTAVQSATISDDDLAFNTARSTLNNLSPDQGIDSQTIDALLSKYPQLTDEILAYADALESGVDATEALADVQNELNEAITADNLEEVYSLMEDYDAAETAHEQEEAYESLRDVLEDMGIDTSEFDTMQELMAQLRDETWLVDEAFRALQSDAFLRVAGSFNIDTQQANSALDALAANGYYVSNMTQEVIDALVESGQFTVEEVTLPAEFPVPRYTFHGGINPSYSVELESFPTESKQSILVPTGDNPFAKKRGGGGSKSGGGGNKSTEKKSILSSGYESDNQLFETQVDLMKSLQNLYEEGSDKWMAKQTEIIDTYKAHASTVQAEYDRLIKRGYTLADEEMQALAKQLLNTQEKYYEAAEELWSAEIKNRTNTLQHLSDQTSAVISLKEAYHDLTQEIKQEQRELDKQYKLARDEAANPGLTAAERSLLFSDEDYDELSGELNRLLAEADQMYADYLEQIEAISEDNTAQIEFITNEYERQYELKMKEYEIAKAQLALTRARNSLENVQNERNVAMLIDGKWTWVADSEAVKSAMEEVANAEQELADAQDERDYEQEIAVLEDLRDQYESEIASLEALKFSMDSLAESIDELTDSMNNQILKALSSIGQKALAKYATGGVNTSTGMAWLDGTSNAPELIFNNADARKLWSNAKLPIICTYVYICSQMQYSAYRAICM